MKNHNVDDSRLTLIEHLTELRTRLIRSVLGIILTTLLCGIYAEPILEYSIQPLKAVLAAKARVETWIVHTDAKRIDTLRTKLRTQSQVSFRGATTDVEVFLDSLKRAAYSKRPIDLVLISTNLPKEKTDQINEALNQMASSPSIVYLLNYDNSSNNSPNPAVALDEAYLYLHEQVNRLSVLTNLLMQGADVIAENTTGISNVALRKVVKQAASNAGKISQQGNLVVLSPLEPFFAYLKIALVCGLFLACPIWLFQAWQFIAPGLYSEEKKFALPVVLSGSILFITGGAFAYYILFPVMFDVLINQMMPASLVASFTIDNYLGLLMRITVAFGVIFELPLILVLLSAVGLVSSKQLRGARRYAFVGSFILGALLTPADPISQVMMALPLVLFYELGVLLAQLFENRRIARQTDEDLMS